MLRFFQFFKVILLFIAAFLPFFIFLPPYFVETTLSLLVNTMVAKALIILYLILAPLLSLSFIGVKLPPKNAFETRGYRFFSFDFIGKLAVLYQIISFAVLAYIVLYYHPLIFGPALPVQPLINFLYLTTFLLAIIGLLGFLILVLDHNDSTVSFFHHFTIWGTIMALFSVRAYLYPVNYAAVVPPVSHLLTYLLFPYLGSLLYCICIYRFFFTKKLSIKESCDEQA